MYKSETLSEKMWIDFIYTFCLAAGAFAALGLEAVGGSGLFVALIWSVLALVYFIKFRKQLKREIKKL